MPQVAKNGTLYAHFGPSWFTFEADWGILASLDAFFRTSKHFFCAFVQYSNFFAATC